MAINEVTSIDVKSLPPFKRLIMTIGELPTSYLESMSYAELLMWFCNFLQNKVLPTINNNADALQDVITYLEDLDLQDEVNNKLDEMVESGQLQEIVAEYLNANALWCFDNVDDMKSATNLIDGSYAKTLGYYEKNDGGESLYKIRNITTSDVVDNASIIALNETLIAELIIIDNTIKFNQFGAKGNNSTFDNTSVLLKAINFINDNKKKLLFTDEEYYFSTPINNIHLRYCELSSDIYSTLIYTGSGYFITFDYTNNTVISKIKFKGDGSNNCINFGDTNSFRTFLQNVMTEDFVKTLYIGRAAYFYISNCNFFAKTTNDTLIEIGNRTTKQGSELITIDNCILSGGETLDATGDFIRINQTSTLRITNTDFANTLGRWIYFNTSSNGDMFDIQINGCTFTRAKHGIVFDLTTSTYPNNIIFDKPLFSEHGNWSDGEDKIISINRTGTGLLQSCIFRDITVTRINSKYPSSYIFYAQNNHDVFINVIRKPINENKYLITGAKGLFLAPTLTAGTGITLDNFICNKNKINNLVSMSGLIRNTSGSNIAAYSTLASGLINPLNGVNLSIIATDSDNNIYPLYIESGILKSRRTLPADKNLRVGCTYESID